MPAIRQDQALLRITKQINDIWSALRRVTVNLPLFDIANENTPTQLTADQDNYVIGNYDLLRLSSSQAVAISGLRGGIKGRFLRIFNIGNYPITLEYQSASSDAANRFKFSNGQDAVVAPGSNVTIYYDASTERWIGGDTVSAGAVYAGFAGVSQSIPSGIQTLLEFFVITTDQYGFANLATNQFTIQFDGFYLISMSGIFLQHPTAGTGRSARIEFGNTVYIASRTVPNVAGKNMGISVYEAGFFHAGEVIQFKVQQDSGIPVDIDITRAFIYKLA